MLPRTSIEQFQQGKPIPKDQLQPGDLVFFKNTYRKGISHVGIYIGEGNFLHAASTSKGIIVTSLSEPHYANRYAGARRIALDKPAPAVEDTPNVDMPSAEMSAVAPRSVAPMLYEHALAMEPKL